MISVNPAGTETHNKSAWVAGQLLSLGAAVPVANGVRPWERIKLGLSLAERMGVCAAFGAVVISWFQDYDANC